MTVTDQAKLDTHLVAATTGNPAYHHLDQIADRWFEVRAFEPEIPANLQALVECDDDFDVDGRIYRATLGDDWVVVRVGSVRLLGVGPWVTVEATATLVSEDGQELTGVLLRESDLAGLLPDMRRVVKVLDLD